MRFGPLISWEIKENWRFPMIEVNLFFLILPSLAVASSFSPLPGTSLIQQTNMLLLLSQFLSAIIFSRSIAGGLSRGEFKLLLTYPITRNNLIFTKLVVDTLIPFVIMTFVNAIGTYLSGAGLSAPFWLAELISLIAVTYIGGMTILIGLLLKSESTTMLVVLMIIFATEFATSSLPQSVQFVSVGGTWHALSSFIGPYGLVLHTNLGQQAALGVVEKIAVIFATVASSLFYSNRFMELD